MRALRPGRVLSVLLVGALAVLGLAAEPPSASAAAVAAAKALHEQAVRVGAVWTALQLEAWGRRNGLSLRPVLGAGGEVFGDPLFAFPDPVRRVSDRGAVTLVNSGNLLHLIAADGRPVALPVKTSLERGRRRYRYGYLYSQPDTVDTSPVLSDDVSRVLTTVVSDKGRLDLTVSLVLLARTDWSHQIIPDRGETLSGAPALAGDGSAIALALRSGAGGKHRIALLTRDKVLTMVDGGYRIVGVGPAGRWLAYTSTRNDGLVLRLAGGEVLSIDGVETGAGAAAFAREDALHVVGAGGTVAAAPRVMGLGRNPKLDGVGEYLLVTSGDGATTVGGRDELDRPIPAGRPQPPTTAVWRWRDLAAGAATAAPVHLVTGTLRPSPLHVGSFYHWRGGQVLRLDLDRGVDVPVGAAEGEVRSLARSPSGQHVLIERTVGGRTISQLVDAADRECLRLDVRADLSDPSWVLIGEGGRWRLLTIDPDPAKRREVALALPEGRWQVRADSRGGWILATSTRGEAWTELDPVTGAEVPEDKRRGKSPADYPQRRAREAKAEDDRDGDGESQYLSWYSTVHRIAPRTSVPLPAGGAERGWLLRDIWIEGRGVIALGRDGEVYAANGSGAPFAQLGHSHADAWSYSGFFRTRDRLVVGSSWDGIYGVFGPGPTFTPQRSSGTRTFELRDAWHIREYDHSFTAPGGGGYHTWDAARCGFTPVRLRGPDASRLLIVTPPVVLAVPPAAVGWFATRVGRR